MFRRVAAVAWIVVLAGGAALAAELDTDRPGGDYRKFPLQPSIAGYAPCEAACLADNRCSAWTFVKPGIQGPQAMCWLKKNIPGRVRNSCCVSGLGELSAD